MSDPAPQLRSSATFALLLAVTLSACAKVQPDPNICLNPVSAAVGRAQETNGPNDSPLIKLGHARTAAENCVHRAAYNLAGARDDAAMVADAVVVGCGYPIEAVALSIVLHGGNDETAMAFREEMTSLALFRVVQARAGHCATPKYEPLLK